MASTVWRGFLTFGLISIPVRLFRAARAERIPLRRLHAQPAARTIDDDSPLADDDTPDQDERPVLKLLERGRRPEPNLSSPLVQPPSPEPLLTPVHQAAFRQDNGKALPAESIVKGYEFEKNRFVALNKDELKNLAPKTSTEMQIEEFVRLDEIDPVYFETSYYIHPDDAGKKAYALLFASLKETGLVALAKFAMHNREHVVVVRTGQQGILAHTMSFTSEVRADEEFRANAELVAPKELALAHQLIASLTAPFEPAKYRDTYREQLEAMIAKKVAGSALAETPRVQKGPAVVDIADALRRSLASLKRPPQSEATSNLETRKSGLSAAATAKKQTRSAGAKR